MTRKCHNYTLQPDPRHREEETQRTKTINIASKKAIKVKEPAISYIVHQMIAKPKGH